MAHHICKVDSTGPLLQAWRGQACREISLARFFSSLWLPLLLSFISLPPRFSLPSLPLFLPASFPPFLPSLDPCKVNLSFFQEARITSWPTDPEAVTQTCPILTGDYGRGIFLPSFLPFPSLLPSSSSFLFSLSLPFLLPSPSFLLSLPPTSSLPFLSLLPALDKENP